MGIQDANHHRHVNHRGRVHRTLNQSKGGYPTDGTPHASTRAWREHRQFAAQSTLHRLQRQQQGAGIGASPQDTPEDQAYKPILPPLLRACGVESDSYRGLTEFRQPLQVQSHLEMSGILVQLGHIQRT